MQGLKGNSTQRKKVGGTPLFYHPPNSGPISETKTHEDGQNERAGATEKQMLWRDGQDFCSRCVYHIESRV